MLSTPQRSAGDVSHPPEVLGLTACALYHTGGQGNESSAFITAFIRSYLR